MLLEQFSSLGTGFLPAELGQLTNLRELFLSNNAFTTGAWRHHQIYRAQKQIEKRIARTGPSLPETLRLLAPLASTLEQLNLSENKLGGTITPDIAAFTKLTVLGLSSMGLEGASLGTTRYTAQKRIEKPIANLL